MKGLLVFCLFASAVACKARAPSASGAYEATDGVAAMPTFAARLGLDLDQDLTVRALAPVSPACVMGVRAGDQIVAIGDEAVATIAELDRAGDANIEGEYRPWCIQVRRDGKDLSLPGDCDFDRILAQASKSGYQCDALSMTFCGKLPPECSGE